MRQLEYKTSGTCSQRILVQLSGNVVEQVRFVGGCSGNLQGLCALVKGRDVGEIITMLEGIKCQNGTSCPDQLAKALKQAKVQA